METAENTVAENNEAPIIEVGGSEIPGTENTEVPFTGETPLSSDEETSLDDVPDSNRPYVPQTRYVLVCTSAEFSKSKSSGNNMIAFEWEIVSPRVVTFKGQEIVVEGVKLQEYASLQPQALGRIKTLHKMLGLPMSINTKAPNTNVYMGKALAAVVKTESKAMTIEGTNEPILDASGKPIANNQYRVVNYIVGEPKFNREVAF